MSENRIDSDRETKALTALLDIMAALRHPIAGCPWDRAQTFATIAPYTIEEAYEVADAIERNDLSDLREELGDLLFQVVFHAQMAAERGAFTFADVAEGLNAKMIARHPHVFGQETRKDAAEQTMAWEAVKSEERSAKYGGAGVLAGVARALPALLRAEKLTKRAARIGFDWATADDVLAKLDEELAELAEARVGGDQAHMAEEMGDILFVIANLARKLDIDPEAALRAANAKFTRRFEHMEAAMRAAPRERSLADLEALWLEAKAAERLD
jgi:MazG family protein